MADHSEQPLFPEDTLQNPIALAFITPLSPVAFIQAADRLNERRIQLLMREQRQPPGLDTPERRGLLLLTGIGTMALERVVVEADDHSNEANAIRIARQMGEWGVENLWRAEQIARHVALADEQIARTPLAPYLFLEEEGGGLAVEAGTANRVFWRIDNEIEESNTRREPKLVLGKATLPTVPLEDRELVGDARCKVVTDTYIPDRIIADKIAASDVSGTEQAYQAFLDGRFAANEEFPPGAAMLALGKIGIANLLTAFGQAAGVRYNHTTLGALEFRRMTSRMHQALQQVQEGEEWVRLGALPNLTTQYEHMLNVHMEQVSQEAGMGPSGYSVAQKWRAADKVPTASRLTQLVADDIYRDEANWPWMGITPEELHMAVGEEVADLFGLQSN